MIVQSEDFKQWLENKQLSPKTIKEYTSYISKLILFEQLNQETAMVFLNAHNNNVARAFLKNLISYYKTNPSKVLEAQQDLDKIRDIEIPKITGRRLPKIPDVLTKGEIQRISQKFLKEQYRLMFLISYEAGLRCDELLSLSPNKVRISDWYGDKDQMGEMIVKGKGSREGIALISSPLMHDFVAWLKTRLDLSYDKPIWTDITSSRKWRGLIYKASDEAIGKKINTHLLRHSRATHLLDSGMDIRYVQEFLRHADISSTQRYTHVNKKRLKEIIQKLEPITPMDSQ